LEPVFRSALLSKSPLLATPFANRPIDKRSEAVFNPMSPE
jgi:hypothetical protein